jgi:hypothetical protein
LIEHGLTCLLGRKYNFNTLPVAYALSTNLEGIMANKPTHDLCIISGEGKAAVWTRVAALWATKDGEGFSGEIPTGVLVTGRVVILKRKAGEADV